MDRLKRTVEWVDWILSALLSCGSAWCIYVAHRIAADAALEHRFQDGSGLVVMFGVLFIAPAAILFALSAVLLRLKPWLGWTIQAIAVAWLPASIAADSLGFYP